ncbi:hypothetical protein SAMN05216304_113104 [Bosea sp. OK403]|uniref:hypothetical protein n=1 Tax=Bosea sp. OK403 TaxID=1855286 RepID=UPI0008EBA5A3|nr:hypothetical protein [Bosea sp. OK403]SFJ75219.1 hypothetical protein SAMN05216304_113104 [Bosea sp. OK403]
MAYHIFFSWQSDTPNAVGRSMIEACLERAIGLLQADAEVDLADRELAIDKDTLHVPGSPAIAETIYGKIDRAAVFLSDLTYVALRPNGGGIPNPNVLIEHGWALKSLSSRRVISVMNTALGDPDQHELPFDLRHVRRPILYACALDANQEDRKKARGELTKHLAAALRAIFNDDVVRAGLRAPAPHTPHPRDVELLKRVHRQLPLTLRQFLHQHNFGSPFRLAHLDPIHDMNETWVGAAYEFHDPEVQGTFSNLQRVAGEFGGLVLERIYAMDRNPTMGWPKTDQDVAQGVQPGTQQAIKEMNAKAVELCATIDAFDRIARDRIPVASGIHSDRDDAAEPNKQAQGAISALQDLAFDMHRGALPEIVTQPRLTLRLVPFEATEGRRLDPRRVGKLQQQFPPSPHERVKADSDGRQWWSCAVPRRRGDGLNPETSWRMRLVRPGHLEYQVTIGHRIDDDPQIMVDGRRLEALIVRNLERMAAIANDLDLAGPALVSISLDGVEDVELSAARPGGRRMRKPEVILPVAKLAEMNGELAAEIQEQLDILWQTAGWIDGSPSFSSEAWAGYSDKQNYDID